MAKAKSVVRKSPTKPEIELRRWCIEQATRWPMESFNAGGVYSGGGGYRQVEVDLLSRAQRIYDWVTK